MAAGTGAGAAAGARAGAGAAAASAGAGTSAVDTGISKIQHVIVIMQENRSFDSYFGTFPGADGIPVQNGAPAVCVPHPASGSCVKPYYDPSDRNSGGPHSQSNATADIDGGKMDGFIAQAEKASNNCAPNAPACAGGNQSDVMGYHDARDLPNYWAYARDFTLQDHMFEPNASWSLPEHLYMVSEWSAKCSRAGDPQSCVNALQNPGSPPDFTTSIQSTLIGKCRAGLQKQGLPGCTRCCRDHTGHCHATAHTHHAKLCRLRFLHDLPGRDRQSNLPRSAQAKAAGRRQSACSA
ncbi:hypothetical protein GCM10027038_03880 [Arthrobacter bambusae]